MAKPWVSDEFAKLMVRNQVEEDSSMSNTWDRAYVPKAGAPLRTNGPTLAEYVAAGYKAENYPPAGYAVNSLPPEVQGAQLPPVVSGTRPLPPAGVTEEDRITELENVVHTLALSVSGSHWDKGGWLERVGARIKAGVKKVV